MTESNLDVLAIGDAMVDVIARADDAFLDREGLVKGSMRMLDAEEATSLYGRMGPAREISGGSAANSAAGIAGMGGHAAFVGQVADDPLGQVFAHELRAAGVEYHTPVAARGSPTGRCLILVTPDGERTMNTYPGAARELGPDAIAPDQVARASILYLEAYLWQAEPSRAAVLHAAGMARAAGQKVALTLSDIACIARHRADFAELLDNGAVDILIGNEKEVAMLADIADLAAACASLGARAPLVVATRSEKGAVAYSNGEHVAVPAAPAARVLDTTGAGDLFAAGFLLKQARGASLQESLATGARAAAEVIASFGARPQGDLRALAATA